MRSAGDGEGDECQEAGEHGSSGDGRGIGCLSSVHEMITMGKEDRGMGQFGAIVGSGWWGGRGGTRALGLSGALGPG